MIQPGGIGPAAIFRDRLPIADDEHTAGPGGDLELSREIFPAEPTYRVLIAPVPENAAGIAPPPD